MHKLYWTQATSISMMHKLVTEWLFYVHMCDLVWLWIYDSCNRHLEKYNWIMSYHEFKKKGTQLEAHLCLSITCFQIIIYVQFVFQSVSQFLRKGFIYYTIKLYDVILYPGQNIYIYFIYNNCIADAMYRNQYHQCKSY
jgi:hypothetical protein